MKISNLAFIISVALASQVWCSNSNWNAQDGFTASEGKKVYNFIEQRREAKAPAPRAATIAREVNIPVQKARVIGVAIALDAHRDANEIIKKNGK